MSARAARRHRTGSLRVASSVPRAARSSLARGEAHAEEYAHRDSAVFTPSIDAHAYPRPQLRRDTWTCLNGIWDFALDYDGRCRRPEEISWDSRIVVPFSPETP